MLPDAPASPSLPACCTDPCDGMAEMSLGFAQWHGLVAGGLPERLPWNKGGMTCLGKGREKYKAYCQGYHHFEQRAQACAVLCLVWLL